MTVSYVNSKPGILLGSGDRIVKNMVPELKDFVFHSARRTSRTTFTILCIH